MQTFTQCMLFLVHCTLFSSYTMTITATLSQDGLKPKRSVEAMLTILVVGEQITSTTTTITMPLNDILADAANPRFVSGGHEAPQLTGAGNKVHAELEHTPIIIGTIASMLLVATLICIAYLRRRVIHQRRLAMMDEMRHAAADTALTSKHVGKRGKHISTTRSNPLFGVAESRSSSLCGDEPDPHWRDVEADCVELHVVDPEHSPRVQNNRRVRTTTGHMTVETGLQWDYGSELPEGEGRMWLNTLYGVGGERRLSRKSCYSKSKEKNEDGELNAMEQTYEDADQNVPDSSKSIPEPEYATIAAAAATAPEQERDADNSRVFGNDVYSARFQSLDGKATGVPRVLKRTITRRVWSSGASLLSISEDAQPQETTARDHAHVQDADFRPLHLCTFYGSEPQLTASYSKSSIYGNVVTVRDTAEDNGYMAVEPATESEYINLKPAHAGHNEYINVEPVLVAEFTNIEPVMQTTNT